MSLKLLNTIDFNIIKERSHAFYGIAFDEWTDLCLLERTNGLWLSGRTIELIKDNEDIEVAGLRIFSGDKAPYKPTFAFFHFFQKAITKGFVEFDDLTTNKFVHREDIELEYEVKGYWGVKNKGRFIGVGLGKGFTLMSQVPKKIKNQLIKI